MRWRLLLTALVIGCTSPQMPITSNPVQLYAAGSLRDVLTEIAKEYDVQGKGKVVLTTGASGLLADRIIKGEHATVFASADMGNPERLSRSGDWQQPIAFVQNRICALVSPKISVTPETLLDVMLQPSVRLGTSTPKADPFGDYAWELFRRADAVRPGSLAALDAKALKLTGGPDSLQAPAGKNTYAWLMEQDKADIFLTYCTVSRSVKLAVPALNIVEPPQQLQVAATYGVSIRKDNVLAERLAKFILSSDARIIFERYGFTAP